MPNAQPDIVKALGTDAFKNRPSSITDNIIQSVVGRSAGIIVAAPARVRQHG